MSADSPADPELSTVNRVFLLLLGAPSFLKTETPVMNTSTFPRQIGVLHVFQNMVEPIPI